MKNGQRYRIWGEVNPHLHQLHFGRFWVMEKATNEKPNIQFFFTILLLAKFHPYHFWLRSFHLPALPLNRI